MNPDRKYWNHQQQVLREALTRSKDHARAIELFLNQHGMVHSSELAPAGSPSLEEPIWQGLTDAAARRIAPKGEHSIAWIFWHIARIEDVTMNLLLAGTPQLILQEGWLERMKVTESDTGNAMDLARIARLSAAVNLAALRDYRLAVGRRPREIVLQLVPEQLKEKVQPKRLQQVLAEGAVEESAHGLIDYWGGLTLAGLLLMPPTRHNFIHLNEAMRLKTR